MQKQIGNYLFEVDHYTVYDSYSRVTISFASIPIGYFDSHIETVTETIRNEYELERFAEEWVDKNQI